MITHPGKPEGWMETEDFFITQPAEIEAQWYEEVQRDYVLRLFHRIPVNDVVVIRNGVTREYKNIHADRITEIGRIVRDRRIEFECNFMYYTEISFSFDTERHVSKQAPS